MHPQKTTSIVLGGGGVTGIAWLIGIFAGLQRNGFSVPRSCEFIGTSAGSVMCAQLAHGLSSETLLEQQLQEGGTGETFRPYSQRDADAKNRVLVEKVNGDLVAARKRIGAFALRSETPSLDERRAIIRTRLDNQQWPDAPLRLTAVDVESAERVVLDKSTGLSLLDAVMASCAVPGVWPSVPFANMKLMDGGLYSMTNADLALGSDHVLILAPLGYSDCNPVSGHLRSEVERLRQAGASVHLIVPDEESTLAIGDNVLDPAGRGRSAEAGLRQGLAIQGLDDIWRG